MKSERSRRHLRFIMHFLVCWCLWAVLLSTLFLLGSDGVKSIVVLMGTFAYYGLGMKLFDMLPPLIPQLGEIYRFCIFAAFPYSIVTFMVWLCLSGAGERQKG
jgi:hypothetical protein